MHLNILLRDGNVLMGQLQRPVSLTGATGGTELPAKLYYKDRHLVRPGQGQAAPQEGMREIQEEREAMLFTQ